MNCPYPKFRAHFILQFSKAIDPNLNIDRMLALSNSTNIFSIPIDLETLAAATILV
jgi:hypothetical protein